MNKSRKTVSGVSLTEMLIVIAILGTAVFFTRVGMMLVNGISQSSALASAQREAQFTLYTVAKEIRNCKAIVDFSTGTLRLRVFNTAAGFTVQENPNLFSPVSVGTMTYAFVGSNGETYLRKTVVFNGVEIMNKKLLKNMLVPPTVDNYMFNACTSLETPPCSRPGAPNAAQPPYESMEIWVRMSPLFVKNSQMKYFTQAMKRTRNSL